MTLNRFDQLLLILVPVCSILLAFTCVYTYLQLHQVETHMMATLAVHERAMNNIMDCSSWIRTLTHLTMFVLGCLGGGAIEFFSGSFTAFSVVESAWTDELFASLETLLLGSIVLLLGVVLCLSICALLSSIADTGAFHVLSSSGVLVPLVSAMCFFFPSIGVVQCLGDGGDLPPPPGNAVTVTNTPTGSGSGNYLANKWRLVAIGALMAGMLVSDSTFVQDISTNLFNTWESFCQTLKDIKAGVEHLRVVGEEARIENERLGDIIQQAELTNTNLQNFPTAEEIQELVDRFWLGGAGAGVGVSTYHNVMSFVTRNQVLIRRLLLRR